MATPGRNDPCHCGSGKKYKKCHSERDEQRGRELRGLSDIGTWMAFHLRRLHEALVPVAPAQPAVLAAAEGFFQGSVRPANPLDDALFRDHALFDVVIDGEGGTLSGHLALSDDLPSVGDTNVMRTALSNSYLSLLEVIEVKRGKGFGLRDCLTGTEAFVWDDGLAATLEPMEVVLGRRLPFTDRPLLAPDFEKLAFHGRKRVIAAAREAYSAARLPEDDSAAKLGWLKAATPRLVSLVRTPAPVPALVPALVPAIVPADPPPVQNDGE